MTETTTPDAPAVEAPKPTFEAFGKTFTVDRKPPVLLVSELARTDSEDPDAAGVLSEFFNFCLGRDEYRKFKREAFAQDDPDAAVFTAVGKVIEAAFAVPTP